MEHARSGLQKIVLDALRGAPLEERALLAWPVVCGAAVAAKTKPLALENGVLRVEVCDKTWRAQLGSLAPHYTAAMKRIAGVKQIEFVVAATGQQKKVAAQSGSAKPGSGLAPSGNESNESHR
ncbi:MAG: DUF721 domain-containing protein [Candidatus Korobacteraceae bacterium]